MFADKVSVEVSDGYGGSGLISFRDENKKIKKDGCSRNIFPAIIVTTMVRTKI